MYWRVTASIVALSLGCSSNENASEIKNASEEDPVVLNLGVDLDSLQTRQICVTGSSVQADAAGVGFTFGRVESIEEVARQVGFQSDISFAYGLAKAKASANFVRNLSDSNFSATYLFAENIEDSVIYATDVKIREDILTDDPQRFRARCGNAYVSKVRAGGQLFAAVTFMFLDSESKTDFSSNFDVKVATGAASGAIQGTMTAMINQASEHATMKIEFNQRGGDPASMGLAFPRGSDAITCSLANREQCKALISNIFDYATNVFPGDVHKRPVVVSHETTGFSDVDFAPLPAAIDKARRETVEALKVLHQDRKKVLDILSSKVGYGTEARREELVKIRDTIESNLRSLQSNIVRCVEEGDHTCLDLAALSLSSYPADRLIPTGTSVMTAAVGGAGGRPMVQRCTDFVTGFWGESGVILDRAGAICQGGDHHPLLGGGRASPFDVQCPQGSVLTGVRAHRETWRKTDLVGNLIIECSSLADLKRDQTAQSQDLAVFSPEQPTEMQARCDQGQAAIAVHFRAGTKIDAISLECIRAL